MSLRSKLQNHMLGLGKVQNRELKFEILLLIFLLYLLLKFEVKSIRFPLFSVIDIF